MVEAARAPTGITALATGWGMSEAELEEAAAAAAARWRPTTCGRTTEGLVSLRSRQRRKRKQPYLHLASNHIKRIRDRLTYATRRGSAAELDERDLALAWVKETALGRWSEEVVSELLVEDKVETDIGLRK